MPFKTETFKIEPALVAIDFTDVPLVAVRELAVALKILSDDLQALILAGPMSEDDLRRVEETFWQRCPRDRGRKVAVLVRFRSFLEACRAKSLQALIASYGQAAVLEALAVASTMRLNTRIGFNPQKIARAIQPGLKALAGAGSRPLAA